jgi:hypothetical protein
MSSQSGEEEMDFYFFTLLRGVWNFVVACPSSLCQPLPFIMYTFVDEGLIKDGGGP